MSRASIGPGRPSPDDEGGLRMDEFKERNPERGTEDGFRGRHPRESEEALPGTVPSNRQEAQTAAQGSPPSGRSFSFPPARPVPRFRSAHSGAERSPFSFRVAETRA
jgi:hypothetical protein